MTETKRSKKLTHDQLEAILNTDRIWQHLVKVGYINKRGDVIRKSPSRRRILKRPNTNGQRVNQTFSSQSSSNGIIPTQTISDSNEQKPSKSSPNGRVKSASNVQSKKTNKTPQSTPFSSSTQSTFIENVLIRRAVSPKIIPPDKRCFITMKYFGELISIDFDRSLFIPQDDEVIVMQQHCGGENLIVFKGLLKPNELFSFESRRHSDYPFALGFYINGVIVNRLSVCCEARFKKEVQIGGKRGLFSIISVEKPRPCRRCRYEQHLEKLYAEKPELKPVKSRREPCIKYRSKSRDSSGSRKAKPTAPKEKILYPSTSKPGKTDDKTSKTNESPLLLSKPNDIQENMSDTTGSSTSSSQKVEIGNLNDTKTNGSPLSSSKPIDLDKNDSKTSGSPTLSSKPVQSDTNGESKLRRSPATSPIIDKTDKENSSEISESPLINSDNGKNENDKNLKTVAPRISSPESVESDTSSSGERNEPSKTKRSRPKTAPVNQPRISSSPNLYPADFDVPNDDLNSSISSSIHEENRLQPSLQNGNKDQQKKPNKLDAPIVSSEHSDDDDSSMNSEDNWRAKLEKETFNKK